MLFERRQYPQNYNTDRSYLSVLLTGLAAGLAVGFLFAPRSGKKLRKKIAGAVNEQAKEVQHKWKKTKSHALDAFDDLKSNVGHAGDKVRDEFSIYTDKVEEGAEEVTDKLKTKVDKAKDKLHIG